MRTPSVFVVEDDAIIALHNYELLTRLGYAVPRMFAAGEDLLDYLGRSSPPDLILMDVGLPTGIDGIETARRVRLNHTVPVIFLSSYNDAERRRRAGEVPHSEFMVKPVIESQLIQVIGDILGKPAPGSRGAGRRSD